MNSLLDQTNPQTPNELDPNKSYLEELVGEGKKYKDLEALARSRIFADEHIQNLEAEQQTLRDDYIQLREEYNKALNLQELLDKLQQQQLPGDQIPQTPTDDDRKPLTMDQIESLLEQRDVKKRENENFREVQNKLKETYGPGYSQELRTLADSMGMSAEEVDAMARRNPKAFERLFITPKQTDSFDGPPSSTRRSGTFAPTTVKRDWKYYEKMRKENRELYNSPKTQMQIIEDMKTLGADFG
jgi:hypothetical protein